MRPLLTMKPLKTSPEPSAGCAGGELDAGRQCDAADKFRTVPPLETVAPLIVPPGSRSSVPPALTKLPLAMPPDSDFRLHAVPDLLSAVPPDSTTSPPPPLTVVLVTAVPLGTSITPPLTFQPLARFTVHVPPATSNVVKPLNCVPWSMNYETTPRGLCAEARTADHPQNRRAQPAARSRARRKIRRQNSWLGQHRVFPRRRKARDRGQERAPGADPLAGSAATGGPIGRSYFSEE